MGSFGEKNKLLMRIHQDVANLGNQLKHDELNQKEASTVEIYMKLNIVSTNHVRFTCRKVDYLSNEIIK